MFSYFLNHLGLKPNSTQPPASPAPYFISREVHLYLSRASPAWPKSTAKPASALFPFHRVAQPPFHHVQPSYCPQPGSLNPLRRPGLSPIIWHQIHPPCRAQLLLVGCRLLPRLQVRTAPLKWTRTMGPCARRSRSRDVVQIKTNRDSSPSIISPKSKRTTNQTPNWR
jgi:hypothetical protein